MWPVCERTNEHPPKANTSCIAKELNSERENREGKREVTQHLMCAG